MTEKYRPMYKRLVRRQKQLRAKPTKAESKVIEALDSLKIRHIFQKGFMCKGDAVRLVDFYLPKPNKIIIEVDGDSHKNKEKLDRFRESQINKSVKNVPFIRIKNNTVFSLGDQLARILDNEIKSAKQHQLVSKSKYLKIF